MYFQANIYFKHSDVVAILQDDIISVQSQENFANFSIEDMLALTLQDIDDILNETPIFIRALCQKMHFEMPVVHNQVEMMILIIYAFHFKYCKFGSDLFLR